MVPTYFWFIFVSNNLRNVLNLFLLRMCEPFPPFEEEIRVMNVKKNSKASNIVGFAISELKKDEIKRIIFRGEGEATQNVATQVEIVKRELLPIPLYQWTRIDGRLNEETQKRISILEILLSKEPFEIKADGQQCSTDERYGAALPAPRKTVPPMPVKRIQYGGAEGKVVNDQKHKIAFADALLPILNPRQSADGQPKKSRKADEENPFARPKKRPFKEITKEKSNGKN